MMRAIPRHSLLPPRSDQGNNLKFNALQKPAVILTTCLWLLVGCSTFQPATDLLSRSEVASGNPYVVGEEAGAAVYFIRPRPEKPMGAADNIVKVEINDTGLLEIDKGEYVLVFLKETAGARITVRNDTAFGPFHKLMTKAKTRQFNFAAGRTYYIKLEMVDGEFRGVHFVPTAVDVETAAALTKRTRAVGDAAQSRPIMVPLPSFSG